jgi:hypothetical protein
MPLWLRRVFGGLRDLRWTRARVAGLVMGSVALFLALAIEPAVRWRAKVAARTRGLELEADGASLGWFRAHLQGVRLRPEGVAGVEARLRSVTVEFSAGLTPTEVRATEGEVVFLGESSMEELGRWRDRHRAPGTSEGGAGALLVADGLHVSFVGQSAWFDIEGLGVRREGEALELRARTAHARIGTLRVELGSADVSVVGGKLRSIAAATAEVAWTVTSPVEPAAASAAGSTPPASGAPAPFRPLLPMPDLHALRGRASLIAAKMSERSAENLHVHVGMLAIKLEREVVGAARQSLSVSGVFDADRRTDAFVLDFTSGAQPGSTPLSLHAELPLGPSDVVVSLSGGPVTLALLGAHEGDFGLTETATASVAGRGRVVLSGAGDGLTFDLDLESHGLALAHPKLADAPVRGLDVRFAAAGAMDDTGTVRFDHAEARLGALHLRAHGELEQTADHAAGRLQFDLPTAACDALRASLPREIIPIVADAHLSGTLGGRGRLAFDTRDLDALVLRYDFEDRCKFDRVPPALEKERYRAPFTYVVTDADGKPQERETGPGTADWVPIDEISPFVQVAVLTTEDGSFYRHHGFNHAAIRASLVANLKAGRFVRGASTITMQLAKNLLLSREKTLARKLQEIVLADWLEQTFTKEEMMELYLNVIEFGPEIYGVGAAARHYFGRLPSELTLAESLFLSGLLPAPIRHHKMYEKGEVPASWMKTLRSWMHIAHKSGKISEKELAEGLSQTIVFHREGEPMPTPRPPVRGTHYLGDDTGDDGGWVPVE